MGTMVFDECHFYHMTVIVNEHL